MDPNFAFIVSYISCACVEFIAEISKLYKKYSGNTYMQCKNINTPRNTLNCMCNLDPFFPKSVHIILVVGG